MHYNWNTMAYLPTALAPQNTDEFTQQAPFMVPRFTKPLPRFNQTETPMQPQGTEQLQIPQPQQPTQTQVPLQPGQEIYTYPQNMTGALKLIEEAVAGENEDRLFYQSLINSAPSEEDKEIIRGIRENEITHFGLFRQIYSQLTGRMLPVPEDVPFEEPTSYCEGLKRALKGEQNAVVKYRKILFAMQNRVHINMLTEIITDEIRHGILYNYLLNKNSCR